MFIRKIKIASRSAICFAAIACIVVALGLFSMLQMENIRGASVEVSERGMLSYEALGEVNDRLLRIRITAYRLYVHRDPELVKSAKARIVELQGQLRQVEGKYSKTISSPQELRQFEKFSTFVDGFIAINTKLIALSDSNAVNDMGVLLGGEYKKYSDGLWGELENLLKFNREKSKDLAQKVESSYTNATVGVAGFVTLAAILTVGLAVLLTRSIVRPLKVASDLAMSISSGDLSARIQDDGKDETAALLRALAHMQTSLRDVVGRIILASKRLHSSSEELKLIADETTRGVERQTLEIEQAATAVNEMATAVNEVAKNATELSVASGTSDELAKNGGRQVDDTITSINELADEVSESMAAVERLSLKVEDISKVLSVIHTIAAQTNLLALNAAIEAARAGEAGRGFAVVADEVRALAQRTQQSTSEIDAMIMSIVQSTDETMRLMQLNNERGRRASDVASSAGRALMEISEAVKDISLRNLVIVSATEEQAQVSSEVDQNLVSLRNLAVKTSAESQRTSVAGQGVSDLASELSELVGSFKI